MDFMHLYGPDEMPIRTIFPDFTFSWILHHFQLVPQKNIQSAFHCSNLHVCHTYCFVQDKHVSKLMMV